MSESNSAVKSGLIVTAKQTYYSIELSNAELLNHYEMVQEYHQEISANAVEMSSKYRPDSKLIDQQPEMNPMTTRSSIITFLFELSVMSRVTDGIFYQAVRLYDRYCSKRVVLKDQAKLVVATCLWLSAKTWGGCNHIINNVSVPTGGRFYGPNPRARIPRLSELVHYCGGSSVFDESMFVQMENHILDTLNWEIYEPMIADFVLNVDENCLIQYELYKRQLEHNNQWTGDKKKPQTSDKTSDSLSNEEEMNEDNDNEDLEKKIQLINLKRFLIDLAAWQYPLLKYELFEVSQGIFAIIDKFTNCEQCSFLATPPCSSTDQAQLLSIFINAVARVPISLVEIYKNQSGVVPFITQVKEYYLDLQKKLQLASAMDLSRRATNSNFRLANDSRYFDQNSSPSSLYSSQGFTPVRNTNMNSDNSLFSNLTADHSSPITPQLSVFHHFKQDSACNSTLSVNSISNQSQINQQQQQREMQTTDDNSMTDPTTDDEDLENRLPTNSIPPKFTTNQVNGNITQRTRSPLATLSTNTNVQ